MSVPAAARRPELLAPAGSLEMLESALAFGADAIYAGQPRYSLRVRNNAFGRLDTLAAAISTTHAAGRQFYLVSNVLPRNAKVRTYLHDMEPVVALGPDALIMADPGLIALVRERWPELPVHLSVQANSLNSAAVRFWRSLGIRRVILSRELSLDEVAEIRDECPDTELEVFVHGALCIAYSGRCLLAGYFNRRDANQGSCTNACRWRYRLRPDEGGDDAAVPAEGGRWLIEESERPGQWMPIEEDEHGTYILNSKDLRALEHVERLVAIGVDSLKIEGRTKSPYYVARTTQAYRAAIDAACAGQPLAGYWMESLGTLASRGYTDGFLRRHAPGDLQNLESGLSQPGRGRYVGRVIGWDARRGLAEIEVKNRFAAGDRIEVVHPDGNFELRLERLENAEGIPVAVAPGDGHRVWIALPRALPGAFLTLIA